VPAIHETAYPRLKTIVTAKELQEVYTPAHLRLLHDNCRAAGLSHFELFCPLFIRQSNSFTSCLLVLTIRRNWTLP
jgi:hypothetical protein